MASPNTTAEDDSLNDRSGSGTAANNSILAKVKSTVKGILPNTLSKWFSPGPQNTSAVNDPLNGTLTENTEPTSRRRRRDTLEDDPDDEEHSDSENESENGDNGEETGNSQPGPGNLVIRGRRSINQQSKRRRVDSNDLTREEDTSVIGRQPLTASTPAGGNSSKLRRTHLARTQCTRSDVNHYRHLNLKKTYQNEAPYNFSEMVNVPHGSTTPTAKALFGDAEIDPELLKAPIDFNEYMSPRRVLNLPSASSSLQRAPLSTAYNELPSTSNNAAFMRNTFGGVSTPSRSVRTIAEEDDPVVEATNNNKYNGNANLAKRVKLVNGSGESAHVAEEKSVNLEGGASNTNETRSDYSDGERSSNLAKSNNSRHSSRNSLLNATGINFNAHLEGRKSLFSTVQLNKNSTLSLNTIHQNNFNRSMFGSSSALSDSRLMKKLSSSSRRSSPKITTMYGGANANIRYLDSGAGAGCSNILPTQMRTASSSLPSLNSTSSMALRGRLGSASPHISNATKGILNIMNNIVTPLGEAKKMGSSFMRTPPSHRNRLSDADLHHSRLLRSEGVRMCPYGRPLKPTDKHKILSTTEPSGAPPVKELSIPTKAHLMKIKKLHSSTVELRQIALESDRNNVFSNEFSLPIQDDIDSNEPPKLTKRKTKLKSVNGNNKLNEQLTSPEDLSAVTFPAWTPIPKFDIEIPKFCVSTIVSTSTTNTTSLQNTISNSIPASVNASTSQSVTATTSILSSKPLFQFNSTSCTPALQTSFETSSNTNGLKDNFKFSVPIRVKMNSKEEVITSPLVHIKFSKPLRACVSTSDSSDTTAVPKLKMGSCLEVFKMSGNNTAESNGACEEKTTKEIKNTAKTSALSNSGDSFGSQFKKSSGEWECDVCLVRNKSDVVKCVACETPKSGSKSTTTFPTTQIPLIKQSFGGVFKTKPDTWDCPTCLINNKCDQNSCVACDTKKPGSTDNTSQAAQPSKPAFTFGFASTSSAAGLPPTTTTATAVKTPISQDTEFKKIAASQKSSSWECEACLTRNDAGRKKCICCEQAKPGTYLTETESTPSFKFGATATANFSFGFPTSNAANTSTTNSSSVSSSTNVEKTENSPKKPATSGFTFGAVSSTSGGNASGFTFGIKPTTESTNKDKGTSLNKTETDKNKVAGTSGSGGFKFGNNSTDTVSSSTTTAVPTLTASTSGGFGFGLKTAPSVPTITQDKEIKSSNEAKVKEPEKPLCGGFSFGSPAAPVNAENSSNTTSSVATTITASTTTTTTTANITKPLFSFSSTSTTATSTFSSSVPTATTSATFSFGSPLTNQSAIATTASSSTPVTSNLFAKPTTTTTTSLFGVNTTSAPSTTKTETPKVTAEPFGFLGGTTGNAANNNIFGNFNTPPSVTPTTKVAEMSNNTTTVAPIFGSTNTGTVTTASANTSFMFGTTGSSTTAATFAATNTTNSSFVFGKTPVATTEAQKSSIFGGFGTAINNNSTNASGSTTTSSLFGASATQKPGPAFGTSLFNNGGSATTASNIFGAAGAGSPANNSIVGQQNTPAFGASPSFGLGSAAGSSMGATTTGFGNSTANSFGGNTSATPTFGSFGSSDTTGKKPEAFKFGDPGNNTNTNLFSFGSSNNTAAATTAIPKPAFNFGSTNNPPQTTFSFGATSAPAPATTGGVESSQMMQTPLSPLQQTQQQQPVMFKPFTFGGANNTVAAAASSTTSIFNFSGGSFEASTIGSTKSRSASSKKENKDGREENNSSVETRNSKIVHQRNDNSLDSNISTNTPFNTKWSDSDDDKNNLQKVENQNIKKIKVENDNDNNNVTNDYNQRKVADKTRSKIILKRNAKYSRGSGDNDEMIDKKAAINKTKTTAAVNTFNKNDENSVNHRINLERGGGELKCDGPETPDDKKRTVSDEGGGRSKRRRTSQLSPIKFIPSEKEDSVEKERKPYKSPEYHFLRSRKVYKETFHSQPDQNRRRFWTTPKASMKKISSTKQERVEEETTSTIAPTKENTCPRHLDFCTPLLSKTVAKGNTQSPPPPPPPSPLTPNTSNSQESSSASRRLYTRRNRSRGGSFY